MSNKSLAYLMSAKSRPIVTIRPVENGVILEAYFEDIASTITDKVTADAGIDVLDDFVRRALARREVYMTENG